LTNIEKLDAVDLIIAALRDHEKAFDRLMEKLEKFTEKTTGEGFSYGQALKTVRALAYAMQSIRHDTTATRAAMEGFVHTLNRWGLIPDDWAPDLIRAGMTSLREVEAT